MKSLFLAIQSYLLSALTAQNVNYIREWNNQLERLMDGMINDFALMNDKGDTPAILIEFVNPANIIQLGNGCQIYEPLDIKVHILHQFYDAQDGTQDQDLKVLDIAEAVFFAFQDWMPNNVPVGVITRITEEWDYDHPNVYHFIQTYRTNFVDSSKNRPINGILSNPNDTLQTVIIHGTEQTTNQYYYA